MYSSPTVSSAVEVMRVSSDDPLRICTSGRHTTLRSSSAATVISGRTPCSSSGSKDIESRSRREFSARWITEVGTRRSSGFERLARAIAGHRNFQVGVLAQQQKSAFAAGDRQRRIHHGGKHLLRRKRILQRAGNLHERSQLGQIIGPGALGCEPEVDEMLIPRMPVDFAGLEREGKLVGIAHAEFDAIRVAQNVARDPLAVDPGAMTAVQILDHVSAVFGDDAGMLREARLSRRTR